MNQILVTQKLYVTPELRRKKRMYKVKFFVSVFVICLLFSYYIYAEYDKGKSEEVSKILLASINKPQADATVKNVINDVLIVSLDSSTANNQIEEPVIEDKSYVSNDGVNYTTDAILNIPSLDITYPVLSATSDELLKISLNKYWGPTPNTVGNYCIVGHNYGNGKMFGKLYEMQIGDVAILTDMNNKSVSYEAYQIDIIDPTDVSCTSQLTNGKREITLITCSTYATKRRAIKCREI